MSISLLTNASINDVKQELSRMLTEGIRSPSVRKLAEQAGVSPPHVFDFVSTTFPYIPDPLGQELFIHPNRMAEDYFSGTTRGGDCDDHALLTGAMLGSVGEKVRIVLFDTDSDWEVDHAAAQVYSDVLRSWVNVDTASKTPLGWVIGGEREYISPN